MPPTEGPMQKPDQQKNIFSPPEISVPDRRRVHDNVNRIAPAKDHLACDFFWDNF